MIDVDEDWQQQVLEVHNIKSLKFSDLGSSSDGQSDPNPAFWERTRPFLGTLSSLRNVNDISLDMSKDPSTYSTMLQHVPITKLTVDYEDDWTPRLNMWPTTLTHLTLNGMFDCSLNNALPPCLKELDMMYTTIWDMPITPGGLPATLELLYLGQRFNQPILPSALPPALKTLFVGSMFNQPLDQPGQLPASLTSLDTSFSKHFNKTLNNLQAKLTDLSLCSSFQHSIDSPHLETLYIGWSHFMFTPEAIYTRLTTLSLSQTSRALIASITSRAFPSLCDCSIHGIYDADCESPLDMTHLPLTLTRLYTNAYGPIVLPQGIQRLDLMCSSADFVLVPGMIPESVTALRLLKYWHKLDVTAIPTTSLRMLAIEAYGSLTVPLRMLPPRTSNVNHVVQPILDHLSTTLASITSFILPIGGRDIYQLTRISDTLFFRHSIQLSVCGFVHLDELRKADT
ncbi:hypothetical protein SAMD00019534_061120 [Acytostelium subglobosum LB1]|uniref:hypothetical protein n=1 Tax=Acytostelium subglobosum LB1 TaxID=1410327 RepID=UPI000644EE1D|nr:hypothetical protein SAMD00019534_061120 [Acytostelium subglobosum LB1]GAM22937.1 hypothetical protein SAMD00019534_061120 [Acytostelium subglobosum LB1]|eukprot:XP_012754164.1 hypothetical protein SAMD00019534_061120 [Acytostelium subglobosum LB1]